MTVTRYVANKLKQQNTFFSIKNGYGFYMIKSVMIPKQEFEDCFPCRVTELDKPGFPKGQSPDTRTNWRK